jgi:hypothetical protein
MPEEEEEEEDEKIERGSSILFDLQAAYPMAKTSMKRLGS